MIVALVGVILFLAATGSVVYYYIWRYKDKSPVKYTNVEQVMTDEETLLGDQLWSKHKKCTDTPNPYPID